MKEELSLVEDWGQLAVDLPANCHLRQLAVRSAIEANPPTIWIHSEYWVHLRPADKAALLLHEMLHSWFDSSESTTAVRQAVIFVVASESFRRRNADLFKKLVETRKPIENFRD